MRRHARSYLVGSCLVLLALAAAKGVGQAPDPQAFQERIRAAGARMESAGLAAPFKGVTTNGTVEPKLFEIRSTGVSTEPVLRTAGAFLKTLNATQRAKTVFAVDHPEWRKWANQHSYFREGVSFEEMAPAQREAALAMLGASLSAKGLKLSRDIMRLNETLGELNGNNFVEYGEHKYWISIMGEPSATEPWGWQLDGHHLIVNYFVLRDQVVMTPAFWGSEPTVATSGKFAGTAILQDEQAKGLAMVRALSEEQRGKAVLQSPKTGNNILTQAFSDNVVLDYAGVKVSTFSAAQKKQLLDLVGLYVGNLREGHARVHLSDVEKRLDDTYFAWIGETKDDSVYYYRVHSPVLLIEFDHETPVGLRGRYPAGVPYREHIHAVVRTPNGNDYGKDLLRLHYQQHPH
ncbi:MAG TPA: DUF3500 domain-containing protein [Vicinamibacterales bacterium]|nr:DUF3500 domain-containing protein [Vicinamibacterales bacterium]